MKKNYLFIITFCFALIGNAQKDISVKWKNYNDGETTEGMIFGGGPFGASLRGINSDFIVTNTGQDTLKVGDTVLTSYQRGSLVQRTDLSNIFTALDEYTSFPITTPLLPGDSFLVSQNNIPGSGLTDLNTPVRICAMAYVQNPSLAGGDMDTLFTNDPTPADNRSCVILMPPITSSIEEDLSTLSNNIYIDSHQNLIIDNNLINKNESTILIITNLAGQIVQREKLVLQKGINKVNLNKLSEGVYSATLQVASATVTKKIMLR